MTLIRTSEPGAEPVTITELKQYLRLGHSSEDELLMGLISAAREDLERSTGLALIEQNWRLVLDDLPADGIIRLGRRPVREVTAVTMYDATGEPEALASTRYQLDAYSQPARLLVKDGPQDLRPMNGIEVDFTCGYGEAGPDVPDILRRAIIQLAAHWYEFRSSYGPADQPVSYPAGYERMISSYVERRL
ncbi:MAG: head-tail connector protein [Rhizobiaceae bacterium]|nr:head-tail connector protein [Rhizobiaceae bacterium]